MSKAVPLALAFASMLSLQACETISVAGEGGQVLSYQSIGSTDRVTVLRQVIQQSELLDLMSIYYLNKYEVRNKTADFICVRIILTDNGATIRDHTTMLQPNQATVFWQNERTYLQNSVYATRILDAKVEVAPGAQLDPAVCRELNGS